MCFIFMIFMGDYGPIWQSILATRFQFLNNITHFFTLFYPHVFQKTINDITQTPLLNSKLFLISQLIIIIIIIFFGAEGQIGKETKGSGGPQLGPAQPSPAHISETLDTAIKNEAPKLGFQQPPLHFRERTHKERKCRLVMVFVLGREISLLGPSGRRVTLPSPPT